MISLLLAASTASVAKRLRTSSLDWSTQGLPTRWRHQSSSERLPQKARTRSLVLAGGVRTEKLHIGGSGGASTGREFRRATGYASSAAGAEQRDDGDEK